MIGFQLTCGQVLKGICINATEPKELTIVRDDTGAVVATLSITPGLDYFQLTKGLTLNTNMDPDPADLHIPELSLDEGGNCLYFMPKCM